MPNKRTVGQTWAFSVLRTAGDSFNGLKADVEPHGWIINRIMWTETMARRPTDGGVRKMRAHLPGCLDERRAKSISLTLIFVNLIYCAAIYYENIILKSSAS